MKLIKRHIGWLPLAAMIVTLSLAVSFIPSCASMGGGPDPTVTAAVYTETETMIRNMHDEVARMEARAVTAPLSPDEAAELARTKSRLARMDTLLQQSRAAANTAGRQPDMGDVITSAMPMLGPIGIPLSIVAGAASEWWRTRKKRQSFDRLVGALDAVKNKDDAFRTAMDNAGPAINAELGTAARDMIRKTRNGA